MIQCGADGEVVLADLLETIAGVEGLGLQVAGPDAEPYGACSVAVEPGQGGVHQPAAEAAAVLSLRHIEAVEFAVVGLNLRMGQAAGAGVGVADRFISRDGEPQRLGWVGQFGGENFGRIALHDELGEVVGRIGDGESFDERLSEGALAQGRKDVAVVRPRPTDHDLIVHNVTVMAAV